MLKARDLVAQALVIDPANDNDAVAADEALRQERQLAGSGDRKRTHGIDDSEPTKATVARAIESALAQKCNKEVIVYDDGSPTPFVDASDKRINMSEEEK
jgi:hypothetical protein